MPRSPSTQFVFLPLGGVGEIGMNLAMYGFGPEDNREWIVVDMGVSFAGPEHPGADLILRTFVFSKLKSTICAASSSRMRTKTTTAHCSISGRV